MTKSEYLEKAFELYNEGKIDADTYDAMLMNADIFCNNDDEQDVLKMIGIKRTEYSVMNTDVGRAWKEQFLKKNDVVQVQEDGQLIIITVAETFDTNEIMWI